jgi:hypothetical protein
MTDPWFHVAQPRAGLRQVEAWSGYPLQFAGQRLFPWADQMARDLRAALSELALSPGETLAGVYLSTDASPCDTENRLFVNPAESIPKGVTSLRFERGAEPPPPPPVPISTVEGHVYYYRYRPGGAWVWWEPAELLARWRRVPRLLADDGSCRPVWLAMKTAAVAGQIETFASAVQDGTPFGLRIVVHATSQGPRSATVVSETVIDGTVAAFHARAQNPALIASALASRMPSISHMELEELVAADPPCPLSSSAPFIVKGTYIQITPCDERCYAGDVEIRPDAQGRRVELSGELFTLRKLTG